MSFSSKRMQYSLLQRRDSPHYLSLMMDQDIMQYITGKALKKAVAQRRFDNLIQTNEEENKFGTYGVYEKQSQLFIGIGKFVPVIDGILEIGYALKKEYWGMGYGTEISTSLVNLAKGIEGIHSLEAFISPQNKPSQRILEKCGFLFYGKKESDPNTEVYRLKLNH